MANRLVRKLNIKGAEYLSFDMDPVHKKTIANFQKLFEPLFQEFLNYSKDRKFYLSPKAYLYLLEIVPQYFNAIKPEMDYQDALEQWELRNIGAILGKALIPDSIAPTLENAKLLAEKVAERFHSRPNDRILVRELCAGSGISTVLSYNEIKKANKNPLTIVATDIALESIVVSSLLLSINEIPYIITAREITPEILDFDGVVFQYLDVNKAMAGDISNNLKYHWIFSDHGIAYFSLPIHDRALESIYKLLEVGGGFISCALEPDVKIRLDYPYMIWHIFTCKGRMIDKYKEIREQRLKEFKSNKRSGDTLIYDVVYNEQKQMVIKAFITFETAGVYNLLNAYLFNSKYRNFKDFIQYIKTISMITKTARELGSEVQSSPEHTLGYLKNLDKDATGELMPDPSIGRRMARSVIFEKKR